MKTVSLVLTVLALFTVRLAPAHAHDVSSCMHMHTSCCDSPARWAPRHDAHDARLAITTENGEAMLVLTDQVVAVQLSDRFLHKVNRKLREKEDEDDEDNVLSRVIKTVVLSSVRGLLDHSAECSIGDLSDVKYRQGRLVFTTADGEHVFENLDVSDRDVMKCFSESDARAFVREFHRCKNRER